MGDEQTPAALAALAESYDQQARKIEAGRLTAAGRQPLDRLP
jgi:hypothetical protein